MINLEFLFVCFTCSAVSKNCADTYKAGERESDVYTINPDGSGNIDVFCDQKTAGGGWLVFQKRLDGSVDFYRGWAEYKRGFGPLTGEFWLGLDKIHRLASSGSYQLRVDLEDFAGNTYYAEYDFLQVASESEKYTLRLGSFTAGLIFQRVVSLCGYFSHQSHVSLSRGGALALGKGGYRDTI